MTLYRRGANAVAVVAFGTAAALAVHHAVSIRDYGWTDLRLICTAAFAWLTFTSIMPYLHRDVPLPTAGSHAAALLDRLFVSVIVPAHNEDPVMFRAFLDSLVAQTRMPNRVHVVENGNPGYTPTLLPVIRQWQAQGGRAARIEVRYDFNPVGDKRHAQAVAFRQDDEADIVITIDSDVKLAPTAIASGLAPFRNARTACVTGMLVGLNTNANLLTRLIEPSFVCAYLNGRAAHSMLRSVTVNSGALSFYRAAIWHKYLDHYLNFTIAGRRMKSGDDAMMTRYSLLEGEAVFQSGCWGYTLHPESLGQLTSQRVRWWRSLFWGGVFVLRTFRPTRFVWWSTAWTLLSMTWMTVAMPFVLIVRPTVTGSVPWMVLAWLVGITYVARARYLTITRPGEPFGKHLGLWLLAPLSAVLNLYTGFVLGYVGMVTCLRDGWSSRSTVLTYRPESATELPVPPQPLYDGDAPTAVLDLRDLRSRLIPAQRPTGVPVEEMETRELYPVIAPPAAVGERRVRLPRNAGPRDVRGPGRVAARPGVGQPGG
ncbi:glycosyltransferase [Paractinoplanes rishiriensis]|uniref:Glycosyltransferase n=1 Tax=Paractinoplanes rishiriensis TaxID=1050105 RepID=A0A919MYB7_9ACTN|nr:glycosyltransferase [Actinoplanes rishiriensis]GIE99684.1 hypothetical protein Ari01nite_71490 [Actinoplanes rishiriensis]